jgi:hypothetical protein
MDLQAHNITVITKPEQQQCSLCFQYYPVSQEQICTKCEGDCCPECAETNRQSGQTVCFACPC